jgi:hypothetical protein
MLVMEEAVEIRVLSRLSGDQDARSTISLSPPGRRASRPWSWPAWPSSSTARTWCSRRLADGCDRIHRPFHDRCRQQTRRIDARLELEPRTLWDRPSSTRVCVAVHPQA